MLFVLLSFKASVFVLFFRICAVKMEKIRDKKETNHQIRIL